MVRFVKVKTPGVIWWIQFRQNTFFEVNDFKAFNAELSILTPFDKFWIKLFKKSHGKSNVVDIRRKDMLQTNFCVTQDKLIISVTQPINSIVVSFRELSFSLAYAAVI